MGPRYEPPRTSLPEEWKAPSAHTATAQFENYWWQVFDDDTLNQLEAKAIENNPSLYVALEKVFEARALAGVQAANLYPQVNLNPDFNDMMSLFQIFLPKALSIPGIPTSIAPYRIHQFLYLLPLNLSYEVDLWGKLRDQYDSAYFNLEAEANAYFSSMLTLTADLASSYFQLRSLDRQTDLLKSTIETRQKNYQLTQNRFEKGLVTYLDVTQAEVDLDNVESSYEESIRLRNLAENQIAVLTGQLATDFHIEHNPLKNPPPVIPAGIPSTVLLQRPDIAQLERTMASEHALINAAYASFFPSFTLTGTLGYSSPDLSQFLKWISRYWQLGANASQMVFDGGRDNANLQAACSRFLEASGNYQQQVLTAIQEVEDALNNVEQQNKQAKYLLMAAKASKKATDLSLNRYQRGVAIYLEVVENERLELQAEINWINMQSSLYVSTVELIKAIGGSWKDHKGSEMGSLLQPSSEEPGCEAQCEECDDGHLP